MRQLFICNQDEVESKLRTLTRIGTSADGWTEHYLDKNSNEEWVFTRYKSQYHGGGVPMIKRIPELTIEQLIDMAITSTDTNEIIGASLELSERERRNKDDFRNKLLNRLSQIDPSCLTAFEKERLKIIIYESELHDATNRRVVVGKHFTEIQNDAEYYRAISQRTKAILANIDKYSSKHRFAASLQRAGLAHKYK